MLHGRLRLATMDASWDGSAGELLIIPRTRGSLRPLEDMAVLLAVAKIDRMKRRGKPHSFTDPVLVANPAHQAAQVR